MSQLGGDCGSFAHIAADVNTSLTESTKKLDEIFAKFLADVNKREAEAKNIELEAKKCRETVEKYEANCAEMRANLSIEVKLEQAIDQLNLKLDHLDECQLSICKKQQNSRDILTELASERNELKKRTKEIDDMAQELQKLKNELHLLKNITHISMDLTVDSNICSGYVSKMTEVKPFEFNREETSLFSITNHLWDLISD